jgi:hypothetical protein
LKKLGDLVLDRLGREGGYVAAEVFDGEEQALILDDRDADDIQFRIEEVGAMDWGRHPDLLEGGGIRSVPCDVFGDRAEAGAGVAAAGDEVGFAGILVAKLAGIADDPVKVIAGGDRECAVPPERRKIVLCPGLIGKLQEGLLVGGAAGRAVGL